MAGLRENRLLKAATLIDILVHVLKPPYAIRDYFDCNAAWKSEMITSTSWLKK